jgi:hypothetical protein
MSNQVSQKQAVVDGIKNLLGSSYDPSQSVKNQITSTQMVFLRDSIVNDIVSGVVAYKGATSDMPKVKSYVSSLISNHIRKAKELNGGSSYSPAFTKNTSSSTNKTTKGKVKNDQVLSDLKVLLSTLQPDSEAYSEVELEISKRIGSLTASTVQ